MRIRRVDMEPEYDDARKIWYWLEWLGNEWRTLDEVDDLIAASFDSVAPAISAHLTSAVIDWLDMHAIEIEASK